mgnify:CR=1 FL=1
MKKGFTLMEILFVLLVIALVVSFAVPAIRSVRYDVYNSRAKAALKKLAEARRSYYQQTKGSDISGGFGGSVAESYASYTCQHVAASGIPGSRTNSDVSQLFACGFLDWRDFVDLPYNFIMCGASRPVGLQPCIALDGGNTVYAAAMGAQGRAGSKYEPASQYFMSIGADMQVRDNLE